MEDGCGSGSRICCGFWSGFVQKCNCLVVFLAETAHARPYEPEEGRVVFAIVEKVGEIEGYQREVVCCTDAGIYVSEKPAVIVHEALFDGGIGR